MNELIFTIAAAIAFCSNELIIQSDTKGFFLADTPCQSKAQRSQGKDSFNYNRFWMSPSPKEHSIPIYQMLLDSTGLYSR